MTSQLDVTDFDEFFRGVHKKDTGDSPTPFPWQRELVKRIARDGAWPRTIDIPTGLGKTATLDVAVFCAALDPVRSPRRMFFVVDRRLIVDAAWEHASRIARALEGAPAGSVAAKVATALRQPGDDRALSVTRMRGGVTWDRMWLDRPDRFAIVTGTVDQIGSRLLFRGYGVTALARSIDAAMVGTDSLILVDEAHLSQPFRDTVAAAIEYEPDPVRPTPQLVSMSATNTPTTGQTVHRLGPDDAVNNEVVRRLTAVKELRLVNVKTSKSKASKAMADAIARLAGQLHSPRRAVLVVANTVARARSIFEQLRDNHSDAQVELLTGRSRAPDRELVTKRFLPRVSPDRDRSQRSNPLILVATQTIEVGLDIDVDHLITELAALPALVQRMGRLNRRGAVTAVVPQAIVVRDSSLGDKDPVYGPASEATWEYLTSLIAPTAYNTRLTVEGLGDRLDVSPKALQGLSSRAPVETTPPVPYIPVLLSGIFDSWTRTSPQPLPDTPVHPFLHGSDAATAPVTIVWRDDITTSKPGDWVETVEYLALRAAEGIDVPIGAVRRWLTSGSSGPVSDIDGTNDVDDAIDPEQKLRRHRDAHGDPMVLRYRPTIKSSNGSEESADYELIGVNRVRPGDTIVVPADYGGCDEYGWHPECSEPVVDVADLVPGRQQVLRIGEPLRRLIASYHGPDTSGDGLDEAVEALIEADPDSTVKQYQQMLAELADVMQGASDPLVNVVEELAENGFAKVMWRTVDDLSEEDEAGPWTVLLSKSRLASVSDSDSESSAFTGVPIGLDDHQEAVAARATVYAMNLGLPADVVNALRAAARWHDEGKRDPRFQAMLYGGNWALANPDRLRAKSGMDSSDRQAFRRARRQSGYPARARHEELSARIAAQRCADDPNRDLICHLVASHHGHARPVMPPAPDPLNPDVEVSGLGNFRAHEPIDLDHATVFNELNRRYGRWGLALLETIVRLADQVASRNNEGARNDA